MHDAANARICRRLLCLCHHSHCHNPEPGAVADTCHERARLTCFSCVPLCAVQVRARYEEVLKENEQLKSEATRRIESSLRREKKYEGELVELRGELSRQVSRVTWA